MPHDLVIFMPKPYNKNGYWGLRHCPNKIKNQLLSLRSRGRIKDVRILADDRPQQIFDVFGNFCYIHLINGLADKTSGRWLFEAAQIVKEPFTFFHGSVFVPRLNLSKLNEDITTIFRTKEEVCKKALGMFCIEDRFISISRRGPYKWAQGGYLNKDAISRVLSRKPEVADISESFEIFNLLAWDKKPVAVLDTPTIYDFSQAKSIAKFKKVYKNVKK